MHSENAFFRWDYLPTKLTLEVLREPPTLLCELLNIEKAVGFLMQLPTEVIQAGFLQTTIPVCWHMGGPILYFLPEDMAEKVSATEHSTMPTPSLHRRKSNFRLATV